MLFTLARLIFRLSYFWHTKFINSLRNANLCELILTWMFENDYLGRLKQALSCLLKLQEIWDCEWLSTEERVNRIDSITHLTIRGPSLKFWRATTAAAAVPFQCTAHRAAPSFRRRARTLSYCPPPCPYQPACLRAWLSLCQVLLCQCVDVHWKLARVYTHIQVKYFTWIPS